MAPKKQREPTRTIGKLKIKIPKVQDATDLLSAIVYEKVDDRYLMKTEDVVKNEELFQLLGSSDAATTQLNINYLLCTAIADLDKRMIALEKKVRLHFVEKRVVNAKAKTGVKTDVKTGVKRKLEQAFDMDAENSNNASFPCEAEGAAVETSEEGEINASE